MIEKQPRDINEDLKDSTRTVVQDVMDDSTLTTEEKLKILD